MTRDEALTLLKEHTQSESLIKHALAVESAMREYAPRFGGDVDLWGVVGLIHDFDYERWPNPPDHTREGARICASEVSTRKSWERSCHTLRGTGTNTRWTGRYGKHCSPLMSSVVL
jgi:predicted hydrolase (HD superfamily)